MIKKMSVACLLLVTLCSLVGCDPITRHKILSTMFDGVPSLPPPEQLCAEYAEMRVATAKIEIDNKKTDKGEDGREQSKHQPYVEKNCDGCHDKSKKDGLAAPRNEICFACHARAASEASVHGPFAVGECLTCHLPHSSSFPALLKMDRSAICSTCHREKRIFAGMHDKVAQQKMICVDCHDPHFGTASYFLK